MTPNTTERTRPLAAIDTPFMRAWNRTHAEHVRAERMKDWLVVLGTVAACEALIIAALVLVRG